MAANLDCHVIYILRPLQVRHIIVFKGYCMLINLKNMGKTSSEATRHSFVSGTRTKQFIIGFVISGIVTIAALSIWVWKTSHQPPKDFVKTYEKPFEGINVLLFYLLL